MIQTVLAYASDISNSILKSFCQMPELALKPFGFPDSFNLQRQDFCIISCTLLIDLFPPCNNQDVLTCSNTRRLLLRSPCHLNAIMQCLRDVVRWGNQNPAHLEVCLWFWPWWLKQVSRCGLVACALASVLTVMLLLRVRATCYVGSALGKLLHIYYWCTDWLTYVCGYVVFWLLTGPRQ